MSQVQLVKLGSYNPLNSRVFYLGHAGALIDSLSRELKGDLIDKKGNSSTPDCRDNLNTLIDLAANKSGGLIPVVAFTEGLKVFFPRVASDLYNSNLIDQLFTKARDSFGVITSGNLQICCQGTVSKSNRGITIFSSGIQIHPLSHDAFSFQSHGVTFKRNQGAASVNTTNSILDFSHDGLLMDTYNSRLFSSDTATISGGGNNSVSRCERTSAIESDNFKWEEGTDTLSVETKEVSGYNSYSTFLHRAKTGEVKDCPYLSASGSLSLNPNEQRDLVISGGRVQTDQFNEIKQGIQSSALGALIKVIRGIEHVNSQFSGTLAPLGRCLQIKTWERLPHTVLSIDGLKETIVSAVRDFVGK